MGGSRGRALFEPALELAATGVEMSGPQRFLLEILVPILERTEEGRGIYGSHVRAETAAMVPGLELLRDHGAAAVAELMPGHAADLAAYRVVERAPVEARFEGRRVVTCPAPSKGGAVVAGGLAAIGAREPASAGHSRRHARRGAARRATGERRAWRR